MKEYIVYADLTMCVHAVVTAKSEEDAKRIAMQEFKDNPFDYARKADSCVNIEVTDVME